MMQLVTPRYRTHAWCGVTSIVSFVAGWVVRELSHDSLQREVTLIYFLQQFKTFFPELIFLVLFGGFALILIRATLAPATENTFDILDLINSGGKADPMKLGYVVAVLVLSWGFFALVFKDKLTEWYVMVFASVLLTGKLGDTYIRKKYDSKAVVAPDGADPPPPPPKYAG
jgi:hypothetical protein